MTPTPEQVALVNRNLPTTAKVPVVDGGYGWTDEFIVILMDTTEYDSPAKAVRHFWYERTVETVEYLDLGKPLTQIHRQAKEMLEYWDRVLDVNPTGMVPVDEIVVVTKRPMTFGTIERPYVR